MRHAIKFGDVGLLQHALQECTIIFQAKEGGTVFYATELLRVLHLYTNELSSDPQLREAMLANSLVNLSGRSDSFFEVDRLLEFLNHTIKDAMRVRMGSMKIMDDLIKQIALTTPYMLKLRLAAHAFSGRYYNGKHPEKDASEDIQLMAFRILGRDLIQEQERFSHWIAADLHRSGLEQLGENLTKYRARTIKGGLWDIEDPDLDTSEDVHLERPISSTEALMEDIDC